MKRFLIPFVAFFLLWIPCGIATADEPITVTVNGSRLLFDTDPVTESDRTLVPLRVIFESLGATVRWEDATQTAEQYRDAEKRRGCGSGCSGTAD